MAAVAGRAAMVGMAATAAAQEEPVAWAVKAVMAAQAVVRVGQEARVEAAQMAPRAVSREAREAAKAQSGNRCARAALPGALAECQPPE